MLGVVNVTRSISSVISVPVLCFERYVNLLPLAASISNLTPLNLLSSFLHQQRILPSSICSQQQHCPSTPSLFLMNPRFTLAAATSLSGSRLEGLNGRTRRPNVPNPGLLRASCDSVSPSTSKSLNKRLAISVSSSQYGCRLEGLSRSGRKRQVPLHPAATIGCRPSCFVRASLDSKFTSQSSSKRFWRVVRKEVMGSSGGRKTDGMRIECSSSQAGGDKPVSSSTLLPVTTAKGFKISFCPRCGSATEEKIPVGEHEVRYVCTACGAVHYQNPKMVVGCLIEHEDQVLLCRRNIEPAHGLWTLPAGYMEIGESAAEGAARETLEEACAEVQVLGLFAHIDLPFIGQSYIIFRARLKNPHFAAGRESSECALFKLSEIPFDSLAFSSIHLALKLYVEDTRAGKNKVHHGVIEKRLGAGPSDLKSYRVRDLLSS